jgi:hypothetical protein
MWAGGLGSKRMPIKGDCLIVAAPKRVTGASGRA